MVLVTGGAGYVGSRLVPALLGSGRRIRVVDTMWFGNSLPPNPGLEVIRGDIANFDRAWLDDVDAIIHLAGLSNDASSEFAPELSIRTNVTATTLLAETAAQEASRRHLPIRCIFASTCSVYSGESSGPNGNCDLLTEESLASPAAAYALSKRGAELELLRVAAANPLFCPAILRMGTVFGGSPRMRFDLVLNTFTLSAWHTKALTVEGAQGIWRPLLHIEDAVDAFVDLLSAPWRQLCEGVFNLLGWNYRIVDLAHELASTFHQQFGVFIAVKRNELVDNGGRSYRANGWHITEMFGICPNRAIAPAAISMWNALERGDFGAEPQNNPRFFNVRWLRQVLQNDSELARAIVQ